MTMKSSTTSGFWMLVDFCRWAIILACVIFVAQGFVRSYKKYDSKHTSISTTINETTMHTYPSITFCPVFKWNKDIAFDMLTEEVMEKYVEQGYNASVLDEVIDEWAWKLDEFLQVFSHPENGDPFTGTHILQNKSYWTVSIPHQKESGRCFTYDPPFESPPGWWYGMRFGYVLPYWWDEESKTNMLMDIRTFIHERGKFIFYSQGDFPSCDLMDMSWLRFGSATNMALHYKRFTSLTHDYKPCTDEEDYNMQQCMHEYFARERGCQPPWNYNQNLDIEPCTNLTEIREWFDRYGKGKENYDRAFFTPMSAYVETGCPVPCSYSIFTPQLSYEYKSKQPYLGATDLGSEFIVHLYFENFMFTYESEYIVCDWTCLLGEIGGNLGFFLGGSILGYVDLSLKQWKRR